MFWQAKKEKVAEDAPAEPTEDSKPKPAKMSDQLDHIAWFFARVTVFILVAEAFSLAASAFLCALFYGLSMLASADKDPKEKNAYAPYLAVFFLVLSVVGLFFAMGWRLWPAGK